MGMKDKLMKKLESYKFFKNKIVLYVVFIIALIMIISYLVNNNINAILFFILISILAYLFTKNMIIILGCAIILTFIIYSIQSISNNKLYSDALSSYNYSFIEGMENKEDKDNDVGESLMELKKQNKKLETKISDKQENQEGKENQEGEENQESEEKQEVAKTPKKTNAF